MGWAAATLQLECWNTVYTHMGGRPAYCVKRATGLNLGGAVREAYQIVGNIMRMENA